MLGCAVQARVQCAWVGVNGPLSVGQHDALECRLLSPSPNVLQGGVAGGAVRPFLFGELERVLEGGFSLWGDAFQGEASAFEVVEETAGAGVVLAGQLGEFGEGEVAVFAGEAEPLAAGERLVWWVMWEGWFPAASLPVLKRCAATHGCHALRPTARPACVGRYGTADLPLFGGARNCLELF